MRGGIGVAGPRRRTLILLVVLAVALLATHPARVRLHQGLGLHVGRIADDGDEATAVASLRLYAIAPQRLSVLC